jgi:hypothetical protein
LGGTYSRWSIRSKGISAEVIIPPLNHWTKKQF